MIEATEEGVTDGLMMDRNHENDTLIRLPNGSIIVGEKKRETRTVSLGFAFTVGSSNETSKDSGISHFIEHMLFKGTKKRSALEIKEPIERVGGSLNAYKGRISTVYYAKIPDTHWKVALEILHDLVKNPVFLKEDVVLERNVILEELTSSQDDPYDRICDMTVEKVWKEDFGHSILGTEETVNSFTNENLIDYYNKFYRSNRLIFGVAGNYNEELIEMARELLERFPGDNNGRSYSTGSPDKFISPMHILERRKDLQQVHLLLSKQALGRTNEPDFHHFLAFNTLFGSGMSSILFHNIREKLGVVYNIDSELVSYKDSGIFLISACTNPKNLSKLLLTIKKEILQLKDKGISVSQLNYAKERLQGKLLMSTEGTLPTLSRKLDDYVISGYSPNLEETVDNINGITKDDLNSIVKRYLSGNWNVSLLVPESSKIIEETSFEV